MSDSYLNWPFFERRHSVIAKDIVAWAGENCSSVDDSDVDVACRELVRRLGADGWLKHTAPGDWYESLIPNSRKVVLDDTGHSAMIERPRSAR